MPGSEIRDSGILLEETGKEDLFHAGVKDKRET